MVYAPGTLETDPKKQNMALQQHASAIKGVTADVATNTANIATNTANVATNTASIAAMRENLTASRTYYVRTDGSDSNTGLSNTSGGAFLTLQKAYDTIVSKLDLRGNAVTISAASGTYSAGVDLSSPWTGGGSVTIDGNNATINTAGGYCFTNSGVVPGLVTVKNFTLVCTGGGGTAFQNSGGGTITVGSGIVFGDMAGGDHMLAQGAQATISCASSYTISGGGRTHAFARNGGVIDLYAGGSGMTTTISASITFSTAFVNANALGFIQSIASTRTYSLGAFTVTAQRYSAALNAVINSQGGGASYFPGNSAGTTATGGQYA